MLLYAPQATPKQQGKTDLARQSAPISRLCTVTPHSPRAHPSSGVVRVRGAPLRFLAASLQSASASTPKSPLLFVGAAARTPLLLVATLGSSPRSDSGRHYTAIFLVKIRRADLSVALSLLIPNHKDYSQS